MKYVVEKHFVIVLLENIEEKKPVYNNLKRLVIQFLPELCSCSENRKVQFISLLLMLCVFLSV